MSFQVCPLCKGTGIGSSPLSANTSIPCSVCQGLKIINTITGNPPKKDNVDELKKIIESGNFKIHNKGKDTLKEYGV